MVIFIYPAKMSASISFLLLILLGMLTACIPVDNAARSRESQHPMSVPTDNAYQFPVQPNSEAWSEMASRQEMIDATQVPEEILAQISTNSLVDTIFAYPLLGDMLAYFDLQEGFTSFTNEFNGWQELLRRQDAGTVLLTHYQAMDPSAIQADWPLEQQGEYTFQFTYAEMMLAQDTVLAKLEHPTRHELAAEALHKLAMKQQAIEIYGDFSVQSSAFLLAKIVYTEQYAPFLSVLEQDAELETFIATAGIPSANLVEKIVSIAQMWVDSNDPSS